MSGVRTGSRLQRLLRLRARIDQEIAVEARAEALRATPPAQPARAPEPTPPRRTFASSGSELLDELGVNGHDVKVWAVSVGLVAEVARGRCPNYLIDEYAVAHPKADGDA